MFERQSEIDRILAGASRLACQFTTSSRNGPMVEQRKHLLGHRPLRVLLWRSMYPGSVRPDDSAERTRSSWSFGHRGTRIVSLLQSANRRPGRSGLGMMRHLSRASSALIDHSAHEVVRVPPPSNSTVRMMV